MTLGSFVVGAVLVLILTLIIVRMIKNKKAGKGGCSCGCENCAMGGACHPNKNS